MPVTGGVSEGRHRGPQALVAGASEGGNAQLARLQGDRAHPGIGGEGGLGRVARPAVTQLGDQGRRANRRLRVAKERGEDRRVGVGLESLSDLGAQLCDLGGDRLKRRDQTEHHRPPSRSREARASRLDLVGVDRHHLKAGIQEALDQDAVRALDRHPSDAKAGESIGQGGDSLLVMRCGEALYRHAIRADADLVRLAGPVDSRIRRSCHASSLVDSSRLRAGREEPLRMLIGWCSRAPRPVGASGASHRREALVSPWPSTGLATVVLSRRRSASLCVPPGSSTASLRSASISRSQKNRREVLL
jgi:hypothetical protein